MRHPGAAMVTGYSIIAVGFILWMWLVMRPDRVTGYVLTGLTIVVGLIVGYIGGRMDRE